jgi:hypothetical protein
MYAVLETIFSGNSFNVSTAYCMSGALYTHCLPIRFSMNSFGTISFFVDFSISSMNFDVTGHTENDTLFFVTIGATGKTVPNDTFHSLKFP